jgi:hypothetical protein
VTDPSARPLLVIIPTRSRPEAVDRVMNAWQDTGAFQVAEPLWVYDRDDPRAAEYLPKFDRWGGLLRCRSIPQWKPMVHKLDVAALDYARYFDHRHIGFAGDDHLPRSHGWAHDMVAALDFMGTGIVYPNDGYQGEKLATSWAMTANIVRALERMVPAPVEHLYCDNAVMDLGRALGALRYLPDVLVEHMHPVAGKAADDEQYDRVNSRGQYAKDRPAYKRWRADGGPERCAEIIKGVGVNG